MNEKLFFLIESVPISLLLPNYNRLKLLKFFVVELLYGCKSATVSICNRSNLLKKDARFINVRLFLSNLLFEVFSILRDLMTHDIDDDSANKKSRASSGRAQDYRTQGHSPAPGSKGSPSKGCEDSICGSRAA